MSKPIMGAVIGLFTGVLVGVTGAFYFEVVDWLSRVCLVGSAMLIFQLLGTTIGATIGKPSV